MTDERKHSHYFRPFPYDSIDIYRFLEVFEVKCPAAQHIIKKAVATGKRGHKDLQRDWEDILDSAQRKLDMLDEDCQVDADNSLEFPPVKWFDASEQELGENAVTAVKQETPWYPNDIPGLEWKETTWKEPVFDKPLQQVYVLFRTERETLDWDKEYGMATFYNWYDDGSDFDIVAYAVKKD